VGEGAVERGHVKVIRGRGMQDAGSALYFALCTLSRHTSLNTELRASVEPVVPYTVHATVLAASHLRIGIRLYARCVCGREGRGHSTGDKVSASCACFGARKTRKLYEWGGVSRNMPEDAPLTLLRGSVEDGHVDKDGFVCARGARDEGRGRTRLLFMATSMISTSSLTYASNICRTHNASTLAP
jgi:hypothetical protein